MAIADPVASILDLPGEGRPLGELVEQMVTPEAWVLLTKTIGDRPPPGVSYPKFLYLAAEYIKGDGDYATALRSCLLLIDAWNAGRLIVKGRRGSPIAPLEDIPPPRVGWTVVIESLMYSRIMEPGKDWENRRKIYDLRFYPTDRPTVSDGSDDAAGHQAQRAQEILKRRWPPYGAPPVGMSYKKAHSVVDDDCAADNKNQGLRTPSIDVVSRLVKTNREEAAKAALR